MQRADTAMWLSFEDQDLQFIPMAGRRALDQAGLKLSLKAWQEMPEPERLSLIAAGAGTDVDVARVEASLQSVQAPIDKLQKRPDPDSLAVPTYLLDALGSDRLFAEGAWQNLSPLERFCLANFARRGREAKLLKAYDAIVG